MNWKSALFRVWLVASACWIVFVAWDTYGGVVVPHLQRSSCMERQGECFSYRKANPEQGNPFDCYDADNPQGNLFAHLPPDYGWFGDRLDRPSCKANAFDDLFPSPNLGLEIIRHMVVAAAPPLGAMVLWWIGIWIAAGFRRTAG